MTQRNKPSDNIKANNALRVEQTNEETGAQAMARTLLQPALKNAVAASAFTSKIMGSEMELPGIGDYIDHVHSVERNAAEGDLDMVSHMLAAQAVTLDSMFAEFARRAAMNMGDYVDAAERYGRLALKAQGNCRATLETLAKVHQPREQTVRHVHVNEGGQAIVAGQFHNHNGGTENAKTVEQSHATRTYGSSAALPSPNPLGEGVSITSREGQAAMQDARRHESRAA